MVSPENFRTTNQAWEFAVSAAVCRWQDYFAGNRLRRRDHLLTRQDAVTQRATESDPLVQRHI